MRHEDKSSYYKCDHCGKLIDIPTGSVQLSGKSYDLCDLCYIKIEGFFERKKSRAEKIGYMGTSGTEMSDHDY